MQNVESFNMSGHKGAISGWAQQLFHWAARYRGPVELGWYDFITLFRGSFFGPFWSTIQLALWIGTIALIFHSNLGDSFGTYVLYVGIGFFAWDFISWALGEGPTHFATKGELLKNVPVDISAITARRVAYLVFRSMFQLPVPLTLLVFFGDSLSWTYLLVIPVTILYAINAFSFVTIGGIIGVYFRDFQFFMPTLTRFLFFTTPVFWYGDDGLRKVISDYNPFSYFLELLRLPLSGEIPSLLAWGVVGAITGIGLCVAIWLQANFRNEVIYRL